MASDRAIWRDDIDAVRSIIRAHPQLLHEHATIRTANWAARSPMRQSRSRPIITMLHRDGRHRLQPGLDRAALQGK